MPSVVSKFLVKGEQAIRLNQKALSGAVVAVALFTYCYKIGYPIIVDNFKGGNKQNIKNLVSHNSNIQIDNSERNDNNNNSNNSNNKKKKKIVGGNNNNVVNRRKSVIPALNLQFILQFLKLIRIMIPNIFSREIGLLSGHTTFLFLRTFLSIYVANLEGAIVKFIVRKEPKNFIKQLMKWFMVAIPATFINSMIRYLECKIALSFRTRLVEHSYNLYFKNQSYYRVTVLDNRLDNCAQRLTDDIETVANTVSHLYGQITKPLFDILLMAIALGNLVKSRNANLITGPIIISGVVVISALILKLVSPRFGQLVAEEAEKKGYLRHVHARIVANAEEIAFYNGHKVEQSQLKNAYRILVQHMEHMFGVKLWFVMLEQFLMKYVWSGTGMIVVSLPILLSSPSKRQDNNEEQYDNVSERTHYFTTAKNLLLTGSNAVERLMSSYKDIVELAGHTARVANMFTVLEEASLGIYNKTCILKKDKVNGFEIKFNKSNQPIADGRLILTQNNEIIVKNIPIVSPNCDIICECFNLHLIPGRHLLITGPNGCGKSSLYRILSGLWPIYNGELQIPRHLMFYIPQKPYMTIGTLCDQIIYPDTKTDMINKQINEKDLKFIMDLVYLGYVVERDGLNTVKNWGEILSGGEKQRLGMARLFYHKSKYALLDECTSAVSVDVEQHIYQTAIDMGITLLTIAHRKSLWHFHTHILQFDGSKHCVFREITPQDLMDVSIEQQDEQQQQQQHSKCNSSESISSETDDEDKKKL